MNKTPYLLILFMLSLLMFENNGVARDIQKEIHAIKQEQADLRQLRKHLDATLGQLGREIHQVDQELLSARKSFKYANKKWLKSKRKVEALAKQRKILQATIRRIEKRMQDEANMAWQRDHREPSWLDVLVDGDVTEIPHRQYMMRFVLEGQAKERQVWKTSLQDLNVIDQALTVEYKHASRLKLKKLFAKKVAESRWNVKHQKMQYLKHDAMLKKKREQALKAQKKALLGLLNGLKDALLYSDKVAKETSIRQKKGTLSWPVHGVLRVHFGERIAYLNHRSKGVQIKPSHQDEEGLQVRAMHAGQVRYADWFGGFGLMLVVEYGHGILAVYAHNDALHKQVGDWVEAGDVLADVGSTGWVEKTRLYFEIRDNGKAVNPKKWCR